MVVLERVSEPTAERAVRHVRVAIVGAGFSGLGLAIRLTQQGMRDFVVLERAADIGGTWRDNTYPGCACDVPAHLYSFSFAPNPLWSRIFAPQPEIWAYMRRCVTRYGLGPHLCFNHEVREAAWDEQSGRWRITTSAGSLTADVLALGSGPLSQPSIPSLPGLESFRGTLFHSAQWNHAHDLRGERVAVVGTGASAIQFVPHIQPLVDRLCVFQRTPPWIIPRGDHPIEARQRTLFRALPLAQRLFRTRLYWRLEKGVIAMAYRPQLMRQAEHVAAHHLQRQVAYPALHAKLTPHYTMGCKRILLSDDYYPALMQDNVELVTERIQEVRPQAIVTADGVERAIDTLILATGFHATDNPINQRLFGRDGRSLAEAWRAGHQAYLGTTVAGFPNLFLLIGPNTGLGHNSMIFMIESQLPYILDCLRLMDRRGLRSVEVRPAAQEAFNEGLQRRLGGTVWASGCVSWYLEGTGRNSTLWPGFTWEYRLRTRRFDAAQYELHPHAAVAR